jgi:uncharacterized phage infection (PIP) family protein YhgE
MRRCPILLSVAILMSLTVLAGCPKKEDAAKTTSSRQTTAESARAKPADSADMVKAYALYNDFRTKFVKTLDYGMNIDTAAEGQRAASRLMGEVSDPQAKAFLTKFDELLGQFRSEAKKAIAMNEKLKKDQDMLAEYNRKSAESNEASGKIGRMQKQYESARADVLRQGDKVRHAKAQLLTLSPNGCCSYGECAGKDRPIRR